MWTCSCGVDNEEEAFACSSCGSNRSPLEASTKPDSPIPQEEEFRPMREELHPTAREEMEKTYETLLFEEKEAGKGTARKVLRIMIVTFMCTALALIALFSILSINDIKDTSPSVYISRCIVIWIRSIIITQAVVIIGGILLFLLRESKEAKA